MKANLCFLYSNGLIHCLSSIFVTLLVATGAYGQGVVGFSSQTQPSLEIETQWLSQKAFNRFHNSIGNGHSIDSLKLAYSNTVPATGIGIGNAKRLLTEFDDLDTEPASRTNLGSWLVGVVSDGDFNKTVTTSATTGKAGSLGIDAVYMKPVYYKYTYYIFKDGATNTQKKDREASQVDKILVGYRSVSRPRFALNTLVVLFSGADVLATGVTAGKTGTPTATLQQQRLFGQALLVPNGYVVGNGLSFSSSATYYFQRFGAPSSAENDTGESGRFGMTASLVAVQTNWSSRDTATAVNILAPSLGLVYKLVEGHSRVADKDVYTQVQPFVRYTMRHLFGDVQANTRLLAEALDTRQRTYHAIDFGVTLSINAVRLTTNIPIFLGPKIEGFSRGQLIAGFGLAASIPISD